MKRMNIYKGIAVVAALFLCIAIMLYIYSDFLQQELIDDTTRTLNEISKQSVAIVDLEIDGQLQLLNALSSKLSQNGTEFELTSVIRMLDEENGKHSFQELGVFLKNGMALNSKGERIDLNEHMGNYEQLFQGEGVVSDRVNRGVGEESILVYTVPLYVDGQVEAAVFATCTTKDMEELLNIETFGGEGYSYVIKADGQRVLGSNHPTSFGEFWNIFHVILKAEPSKNTLVIDRMRADLLAGTTGYIEFFNKVSKYMEYTPLPVNDWYLLSVIPTSVVDKSSNRITNGTVVMCSVTMIITGLAGFTFVIAHRKEKKRYDDLLYIDPITGGSSYTKFMLDARECLADHPKYPALLAMELLNLDLLQERYGDETMEEVLRFVYRSIQEHARPGTVFGRLSSNGFVILGDYESKQDLIQRIYHMRDVLATPPPEVIKGVILRLVVGIYEIVDTTQNLMRMQNLAIIAKQSIATTPEKEFAFYVDVYRDTLQYKKQMADEMVMAKENDEFVAYFQPKYDTATQKVVGAEALARWIKPDGSYITPNVFIPLAEENGYVIQIDKLMFQKVCCRQRQLLDMGVIPVPISINLSRASLRDPDLLDDFIKIMTQYQLPYELIELELTESMALSDGTEFYHITKAIHNLGFKILVDDFGTGYSSLMMLQSAPVDAIKLDKSFIDCYEDFRGSKIIACIISLAKALDLPITAEGVETQSQYEFLRTMCCDTIQGFYFAKPMEFEQFQRQLLRKPL